uniref:Effector protein n=1 Tax=Fusarium oxysporum f. sp. apii TaxID=224912 RepID=A0A866WJ25_FUSOX|nr:effector protein [Fusarium oxysporum f. sp. apii]
MIARTSTVLSLALTALSLGAYAAPGPAPNNDVSQALRSPLEARASLCCAVATNNRYIQTVCQYMYESCRGWNKCLKGLPNDSDWCHYCVVVHPEDKACLTKTWPPVGHAPISKRGIDDATILPPEDSAKDNAETAAPVSRRSLDMAPGSDDSSNAAPDLEDFRDTTSKHLDKRAWSDQNIHTRNLHNEAQSYRRAIGLVTIRIIISASNVMTWSVQNSGATDVAFHVIDRVSGWKVERTIHAGQTDGGAPGSQVLAQGGDTFTVGIQR